MKTLSGAAGRYRNASMYDAIRCPVHGRLVALVDGELAGSCDECAAEAARALQRLLRMRPAAVIA